MTAPTDIQHPARVPVAGAGEEFCPVRMMDVELTEPLPTVGYDGHRRMWVLARLHTEPVGTCVVDLGQEGLTPDQLGARLWLEFREAIIKRFVAAGLPRPSGLPTGGLEADPAGWPFLRNRLAVLAAAPFISVVICTRDRSDQLENCLHFLERQQYPRFEVVVVDNAPSNTAVRTLVEAKKDEVPFHYVLEARAGLQRARNAGIAAASGDIIAFVDDDDEPDSHWLAGLACGFAEGDDIGCVSGMVVPARLDTQAQELFEQLGGHCKGRDFSSAIYSRHGPQSPLYPLPPFGVGANMAFRREALVSIGGFDVALGAGTPALGGGDTLALTLVLLAGYRIAYEPAALMRHHHRRDLDSLRRQLHGYSVGLAAFYAALLRHRPGVLPGLLRLVPTAVGYMKGMKAANTMAQQDLLATPRRRQRWWMLTGPAAYIRSMRLQARMDASEVQPGSAP
jgi:cellulose synthase/poly-beta-1,6-N-acetylglucosamine synthase-like glycosyltransferase